MSNEVGRKIRAIRINTGLTMADFGKLIDDDKTPSDSIVSRWEKGISIPNPYRLKRIAEIGNITVEELLNDSREQAIQELISFTREFVESYGYYAADVAFEVGAIGAEEEEERVLTAKKQELEELIKKIEA